MLATVLTASVALVGPPAHDLIDPVPHERLVESMRRLVPLLLAELDTDTTNVLLTLARIWHTTDSGLVVTKDEAAYWALDRIPVDLRGPSSMHVPCTWARRTPHSISCRHRRRQPPTT